MINLKIEYDTKKVKKALKNSDTSIKKAAKTIAKALVEEIKISGERQYLESPGEKNEKYLRKFLFSSKEDFSIKLHSKGKFAGQIGNTKGYLPVLRITKGSNKKEIVFKKKGLLITAKVPNTEAPKFLKPAIQSTFKSGKAKDIIDKQIQNILTKEKEKASK